MFPMFVQIMILSISILMFILIIIILLIHTKKYFVLNLEKEITLIPHETTLSITLSGFQVKFLQLA
jgi:hypothetical protein